MSRKHYVAVAASIRSQVDAATAADDASAILALHRVTEDLARIFKSDNSNFDRSRFVTACGF